MEKTHPSPHFHPLMRTSQVHGDSGDQKHAPYPDTGPESRGEGEGKTTANLWVITDARESKTTGVHSPKPFDWPRVYLRCSTEG